MTRMRSYARCLLLVAIAILCLRPRTGFCEEATRYMVVVTGSELLAGAFPDGHTHFLTRTLRPLGLRCVGSMTVDDGQADILAALEYAAHRAELVIVTGGLGPTDNDVTCEALSEFTGIAVEEQPDVLMNIAQRFRTPVEQLRANLRRQTRVPVGGGYLENSNGTAVGLVFETATGAIVALPGPPRELQPMVRDQLIPYLNRRFGTRLPGSSLTVRFVGLGQSSIDQRMKDHVPLPNGVILSSQFDGSRVDFTFSLPEESDGNRRQLEDLRQRILRQFGERIYAMDEDTSLEDVVIDLLKRREGKLALAEIASGGTVESALSGARNAQEVLTGAYIAPDFETMCRLAGVSEDAQMTEAEPQRIEQLAGLLSDAKGRQWAVVVGQRMVGEDGSAYAHVAIRSADGETTVFRVAFKGPDPSSRAGLTTRVVDELRKRLVRE